MRPRNIFRTDSKSGPESIRRPSHTTIVAYVALFAACTTGAAYAANTIASGDIINGEVKTVDLGNNAVTSAKIADGQVTEADVGQAAVGAAELKNNSVGSPKVIDNTLVGADVKDNALKGADIDESSLQGLGGGGSLPRAQVARDGTQTTLNVLGEELDPGVDQVIQTSLPSGNWVVTATATFGGGGGGEKLIICGLYDANNPVSEGNTHTQSLATFAAAISLTGVSDGGIVRLACATDSPTAFVRDKMLVASQVGNVTGP